MVPQTKFEHVLCAISKSSTLLWKNSMRILKQIVWETKTCHQKCRRPSGSWLMDQNNILYTFYNNSRTIGLAKIKMSWVFCFFSRTIITRYAYYFSKKVLTIFKMAHRARSILVWGVVPPRNVPHRLCPCSLCRSIRIWFVRKKLSTWMFWKSCLNMDVAEQNNKTKQN